MRKRKLVRTVSFASLTSLWTRPARHEHHHPHHRRRRRIDDSGAAAKADPLTQTDLNFIQELFSIGINPATLGVPNYDKEVLVGKTICADLRNGVPPNTEVADLVRARPQLGQITGPPGLSQARQPGDLRAWMWSDGAVTLYVDVVRPGVNATVSPVVPATAGSIIIKSWPRWVVFFAWRYPVDWRSSS
jgi:hypothetical protein